MPTKPNLLSSESSANRPFFEEAASAIWAALGGWSIGIIPIILVVGLVADGIVISSQLKKKMARQKSDVKNVPEINWNGLV